MGRSWGLCKPHVVKVIQPLEHGSWLALATNHRSAAPAVSVHCMEQVEERFECSSVHYIDQIRFSNISEAGRSATAEEVFDLFFVGRAVEVWGECKSWAFDAHFVFGNIRIFIKWYIVSFSNLPKKVVDQILLGFLPSVMVSRHFFNFKHSVHLRTVFGAPFLLMI